jgi:hypothetical protein
MHYYEYCYLTPYARPEAKQGRVRGFVADPPESRSIGRMAEMWDALATELSASVRAVPSVW